VADDEHLREHLEHITAEEKAKRALIAFIAVAAVGIAFVLVLVLVL
jgi:hypothetical protein